MEHIKKILVPSDFSAHSKAALDFAVDLARRYDASMDVIHVFETLTYALPEALLPSSDEFDRIIKQLQTELDADKRGAVESGCPYVATALLQGGVTQEILRFAEEHASDLIVMGTHGRTGLDRFLNGSVAEQVVRTAPCAVLTVRGAE